MVEVIPRTSNLEDTIPHQVKNLLFVKDNSRHYFYGGWRSDLLIEKPKGSVEEKFLLCNSCSGVLRDACLYQTNGIQELRCSVCIPDVDMIEAQLNREVINKRQVYCPLKSKGCGWTNELSELLHHLDVCELFPVACPLGCRDERGEVSRVERRQVETHKTSCPMRTVNCDYCNRKIKSFQMNAHLELCDEFPISCPNECGISVGLKRKEKSSHLSRKCPLQVTECAYFQYGCKVRVQRRHITQHEKEDIHTHLKLTMGSLQFKVARLETENLLLRNKISKLIPNGDIKWKIHQIKCKIVNGVEENSVPFYVGFYKFQACMKFYGENNNVGLFLYILEGEWDDTLKWPLKYSASIVLINQHNSYNNYRYAIEITDEKLSNFPNSFKRPTAFRNNSFGHPNFISHPDILQAKYCKDDSIQINVSVELL